MKRLGQRPVKTLHKPDTCGICREMSLPKNGKALERRNVYKDIERQVEVYEDEELEALRESYDY